MRTIIRPSVGGADSNSPPPPPPPAGDNATPGPSNPGPSEFDASRARVARAQAAGSGRGKKRKKTSSREANEQARMILQAEGSRDLERLKSVCHGKGIDFKDDMYSLILACPRPHRPLFIRKLTYFFKYAFAVDNTDPITRMFGLEPSPQKWQPFLDVTDADIVAVARTGQAPAISTMCKNRGFPAAGAVQALLACEGLSPGGQLDQELLEAIACMCRGKGVPSAEAVNELLRLSVFKRGDTLDKTLLKTVATAHTGKGISLEDAVKECLSPSTPKARDKQAQGATQSLSAEDGATPGPSGLGAGRAQGAGPKQAQKRKSTAEAHGKESAREALMHPELPAAVREAVLALEKICQERNIDIKGTLYSLINSCPNNVKVPFVQKCSHYFALVEGVKSTSSLTSMFERDSARQRIAFSDTSDANIARIAQCGHVQAVTVMSESKGFPSSSAVRKLLTHPGLTSGGQLDMDLFKPIVTMYARRGIPEMEAVTELLAMDVFKTAGVFNPKLLQAIATMHGRRCFPAEADVVAFLALHCLKTSDQTLDWDKLSGLATMCRGRGLPHKDAVTKLLAMPCFQKEGRFNAKLFGSIASLCDRKGLPTPGQITEFLSSKALQKNNNVDPTLLTCVSSINRGRGLPTSGQIESLFGIPDLEVTRGRGYPLLRSISSMCGARGFPPASDVQALLDVPGIKIGGRVDENVLKSISHMQHFEGLAKVAPTRELLSLLELQSSGAPSLHLLKSISSLYGSMGIPTIAEVRNLLSLPSLMVDGRLDTQLLRQVAKMNASKGFPSQSIIEQAKASFVRSARQGTVSTGAGTRESSGTTTVRITHNVGQETAEGAMAEAPGPSSPERGRTPPLVGSPRSFLAKRPRKE